MTTLRGITWAHTRGYLPLVAASVAFAEQGGDVEAVWDRRSLWSFGEAPIEELAEAYDLLVIDHPFVGFAAERKLFLPLDEHLSGDYLRLQEAQSVGPSFASYTYDGHQWALAIDASGHTSAVRLDLLEASGNEGPDSWESVVTLARETGAVAMPLAPIDALSSFFTLCASLGEPPMRSDPDRVVSTEVGVRVSRIASQIPGMSLYLLSTHW